ncbi:MAG: DUF393 domain-containing protein [Ignavibacteriales bacterium]|nr:DUF393 domain-containing protein [Ignavibacteriales bacterium]
MKNNVRTLPLLLYDGDCSFCKLWIGRWEEITGDKIAYAPFQEARTDFPKIPNNDFTKSVQLVLPDGEVLCGAKAVFTSLAVVPNKQWMMWCYEHLPLVPIISEALYRFIARYRKKLYSLSRWIVLGKRKVIEL